MNVQAPDWCWWHWVYMEFELLNITVLKLPMLSCQFCYSFALHWWKKNSMTIIFSTVIYLLPCPFWSCRLFSFSLDLVRIKLPINNIPPPAEWLLQFFFMVYNEMCAFCIFPFCECGDVPFLSSSFLSLHSLNHLIKCPVLFQTRFSGY